MSVKIAGLMTLKIDKSPQKGLGLSSGGAVAHGDGFNMVLTTQQEYLPGGFLLTPFPEQRINGIVVQQMALPVQTHQFAAGAKSGIQGQGVLLTQGRGQQQLPQIVGEYPGQSRLIRGVLLAGSLHANRR